MAASREMGAPGRKFASTAAQAERLSEAEGVINVTAT
jgi:hypothetical protein